MMTFKKTACALIALSALALAGCGEEKKADAPAGDAPAATAPATADLAALEKEVEALKGAQMSNDMMKTEVSLDKTSTPPTIVTETTMLQMSAGDPAAKALASVDQNMIDQQTKAMCDSPQMKEAIDKGVAYKTVMKDKDGKEINSFTIDLTKCKK